jgi:tRNA pseudouridine38/39 synthase
LSALLMDKIAGLGRSSLDAGVGDNAVGGMKGAPRIFDGGDVGRAKGPYTPLLQRERQESVDVVNERYRRRKGIPEPDPEQEKDEDGDE